MKIAVNTRLLLKDKLEGIGWFTYESLKRITTQHPEHQFHFIFDRKYDEEFIFSDNITPEVIFPQARHPFLYYWWFEKSIPALLDKIKPDLFLSPDAFLPVHPRTKTLAVFHDLNFEHYPQDLPYLTRNYYRHYFPRFARTATRIATVSEYSKQDLIMQYGVSGDKIDVVYDGASEMYHPLGPEEKQATLQHYTDGNPYFLFIGALHPRKNLANLFTAFDYFKKNNPNDVQLMIVGARKWWTRDIDQAFQQMNFSNDVVFTGRLDSEHLHRVLASALGLTYVSYFEGFGIPIVEAFRCGVPVITSNVTSMPEVAGDAALLINPFHPESIAMAMYKIYYYDSLRKELIERGNQRKDLFTWQKTADKLWESIEKTIKEG